MKPEELVYHIDRLNEGEVYQDIVHNESVEFRYMGKTGLAIVCEPGDSGGGMQSCWGIDPNHLEEIVEKEE